MCVDLLLSSIHFSCHSAFKEERRRKCRDRRLVQAHGTGRQEKGEKGQQHMQQKEGRRGTET